MFGGLENRIHARLQFTITCARTSLYGNSIGLSGPTFLLTAPLPVTSLNSSTKLIVFQAGAVDFFTRPYFLGLVNFCTPLASVPPERVRAPDFLSELFRCDAHAERQHKRNQSD